MLVVVGAVAVAVVVVTFVGVVVFVEPVIAERVRITSRRTEVNFTNVLRFFLLQSVIFAILLFLYFKFVFFGIIMLAKMLLFFS